MVRRVKQRAGDRAKVVAGVGSNDTRHAVADGRPGRGCRCRRPPPRVALLQQAAPRPACVAHCRAVADATDLPVMLYDIPGAHRHPVQHRHAASPSPSTRTSRRSRTPRATCGRSTHVMAATDLLWFSGEDALNLPAARAGRHRRRLRGRATSPASSTPRWSPPSTGATWREARAIHTSLIPVVDAIMTTSQGAIMAKAALVELGVIESATVRLPLVESPPEHLELLRAALATLPTR